MMSASGSNDGFAESAAYVARVTNSYLLQALVVRRFRKLSRSQLPPRRNGLLLTCAAWTRSTPVGAMLSSEIFSLTNWPVFRYDSTTNGGVSHQPSPRGGSRACALDRRSAKAGDTALGRVGLPDDIGAMIASLVSEDNRWVNAQRIEVSGGLA